jgi:c-di-GMP-binding flagellar brake protein YcgR
MKEKDGDNRRSKRHVVEGIEGNLLYTSDIEVLNLSIDGAAIETAKRLELNRTYTFKIKYNDSFISLRGHVVWAILVSKVDKNNGAVTPVYRAGIRFTDSLSEKAKMLMQFIEDNRIKKRENRLGGVRFNISSTEHMKVDLPHEYKVIKISLSGMLVDIAYPLVIESHYNIELFINSHNLKIVGRVVYSREVVVDNAAKYEIGIEFFEISEYDERILQEFLDTLEEM